MRPTRQETDLEYWVNSREFWLRRAEEYFLMDDRTNEERCEQRAFQCELALQEARGEIIVYSGRRKPEWARKGVFAA